MICETCETEYDPDEGEMCQCQIDAEAEKWYPLYLAEKRAGLLRPQDEIDQELRDAGRLR